MHIAIVAAYWHYPEVAYELPKRLADRGHQVDAIIGGPNAHSTVKERVTERFTVYRIPAINLALPFDSNQKYPYVLGLRHLISRLEPEIVECQSHLFLPTIQAGRVASDLGVPNMVTVHGVRAERGFAPDLAQYAYLYTLGSRVFKKADLVRCLTETDMVEILKYGCAKEKVRIIPNAVDVELFRPNSEKEEQNLVLWVGRFVREKGLECLIEAAKKVVNNRKETIFMLVGDGPLKGKITAMVDQLGLSRNVILTGVMKHDQLPEIMQKASVFAFPSLREGMPLALLEAMACGKPVISTSLSGLKELVNHRQNGLLFPLGDSDALADSILTLLSDMHLRSELGRNARDTIVKKHSWDQVVNQLENAYEEAISNRSTLTSKRKRMGSPILSWTSIA